MKRLVLVVALIFVAACGPLSVKQEIDRDDRVAFESLRVFQIMETGLYHGNQPWPTAEQHQQIGAKLSQAYGLVISVANAGLTLKPGVPASDQVITEVALLGKLVGEIVGMAGSAPPNVRSQATKAKNDINELIRVTTGGK